MFSSRNVALTLVSIARFSTKALPAKTSLKFSIGDGAGSLQNALAIFADHGISLTRLESRPNKRIADLYDMHTDFNGKPEDENVAKLISALKMQYHDVNILRSKQVPWFPVRLRDLDRVPKDVLEGGNDLVADHPGFTDQAYRASREKIAIIASEYKQGTPIPTVEYTEEEIKTWGAVYTKLKPLLLAHACKEHVRMLPLLEDNCGYSEHHIPQLQDISDFLKDSTGFTLRPVSGLLSARNFLYGLAFRVFFSTQYIRHHSRPFYTPEPDICHELLGHAPMFANREFADFSQEIGLASLGATDEQITQLARCYWFSVEFGLCEQDGERKAYGAGLLSSFGELEHSMSEVPEVRPWDPFAAAQQEYPITTYQPIYYSATSFTEAKKQMVEFANSFARQFHVRYDPYSCSIEVDSNVAPLD
jgi:phenylalanine-4-hydroxylase